jgi:hypothetical protein
MQIVYKLNPTFFRIQMKNPREDVPVTPKDSTAPPQPAKVAPTVFAVVNAKDVEEAIALVNKAKEDGELEENLKIMIVEPMTFECTMIIKPKEEDVFKG